MSKTTESFQMVENSVEPGSMETKMNATRPKSMTDSFEVLQRPEEFETARKDPILPCYSLKNIERNPGFFGRSGELELIDKYLLPPTTGQDTNKLALRSFGICGMGGLGKTQIAMQYIFTRQTRFDAIFWLSADDKNTLGVNFASIAQQLGLEDMTDTQDLTISRERVKGWLSNPVKSFRNSDDQENEASWLLVFDNADSLSVLDEYWPLTGRGSVLLTSRDPIGKTNFYTENNGIDVSKLSLEDTMAFIRILTKSTLDSDNGKSLKQIAEILDGLPLAIEQMSSVIRRLRVSYADFLNLYRKENWRLHDLGPQEDRKTYQHTLATVWSLQQFSDSGETLLQVFSMIDPDSIPETLLIRYSGKIELQGYPPDMIAYYGARAELMSASLVALVNEEKTQEKSLALHRLLQEVVLAKMDEMRMTTVFETALQILHSEWPFQSLLHRHTRARWSQCAMLYPHVAHLKKVAFSIESIRQKSLNNIAFPALLNDAGWYLFERGLLEESRELYTEVQTICESSEQRNTQAVADLLRECYNNQGTVANEINDPKGALHYFKLWEGMLLERQAHDGQAVEDLELAIMHQEVAITLAFNEDYENAIDRLWKSWKIRERLTDFEETTLLWPVSNLGFIYCEVGRLEEGQKLLEKYLKVRADVFGVDDTQFFV
ncbi:uncharacterized protein KY384_005763 [Bacidia gigantensis]|uniref:uncharacterized protein n=1 Tax=Bacidia gigantensis TaxID=2732470 RepID=UPI001D040C0E|nr:uncharacterized protein KY384_005763 [Bacidia gigantensis]KAG8529128.1 hypothetical protein KY384_005763 [Bacidia gigantensis]